MSLQQALKGRSSLHDIALQKQEQPGGGILPARCQQTNRNQRISRYQSIAGKLTVTITFC